MKIALVTIVLCSTLAGAKCISIEDAPNKIGDTVCVAGKVLKVAQSRGGSFFLDFCQDYRKCPFTVVVFPSNLKDVGDVRQLEGKDIEIHGKIQEWRGRAEIILRDVRQLKGEAAKIPPIPKDYDVQRKGKFSAGQGGTRPTRKKEKPPQ